MLELRKLITVLIVWWIADILASSLVWSTIGIFEDLLKGPATLYLQVTKVCLLILINGFSAWKTLRDVREHLSPYHDR